MLRKKSRASFPSDNELKTENIRLFNRTFSNTSQFAYDPTLVHGSFREYVQYADNTQSQTLPVKAQPRISDDESVNRLVRDASMMCKCIDRLRQKLVNVAGIDWILLTSVGVAMSIISFVVDVTVEQIRNVIVLAYKSTDQIHIRFFIWTGLPMTFILFSAIAVQQFAPQAAGSGIPEVRTIMSGVVLKEYLTARTAFVKTIALIAALGSGVPIGKMGPFVHTSSAVTTIIGNYLSGKNADLSEKRFVYNDMLVIACAVGVAATFNAPIGGVLFSIELTSNYFAIRNYWRGFYASLLGAVVFRQISLVRDESATLLPVQFLRFHTDHPFAPSEIIAYIVLGIYSGIFGALFTLLHKKIILLERQITVNIGVNKSFGIWNGDMAARWTEIQEIWSHNSTFSYLAIFFSVNFFLTILASTLPIPLGLYAPLFLLGGTFGRLFGELLVILFPQGIQYRDSKESKPIIPAGYALAGAAALSGSATHTLSIAVIAIEMTGEILYLLPIMICVTAANIVSRKLHISVYDTIVRLKKLPHLPSIQHYGYKYVQLLSRLYMLSARINQIPHTVAEFMNSEFDVIHGNITCKQIKDVLRMNRSKHFPVVKDPESMLLIGITTRQQLRAVIKACNRCTNGTARKQGLESISDKEEDAEKPQEIKADSSKIDIPSSTSRFTINEVPSESVLQDVGCITWTDIAFDTVPLTLNESANLLEINDGIKQFLQCS